MGTATVILFLWTTVAAKPGDVYKDWRPMGEFNTVQSCNEGARLLNLNPENFRCIPK